MGDLRTQQHKPGAAGRVAAPAAQRAAQPVKAARLQQRIGLQGTQALLARAPAKQRRVRSAGGNAAVVEAELKKLPKAVTEALRKKGIAIVAVKDTIVEQFADLHGVTPRGWGGTGKTWDQVPGVFREERKTVAVATSGKFRTGSTDMILHEVGHAYDYAMGRLSSSEPFVKAYDADKDKLTAYFKQAGSAGREELFAESFANYYSRNKGYFKNKPHVQAYWKNLPQQTSPPKVEK